MNEHTLTSLVESGDSPWPHDGPECEPSASLKLTPTPVGCSQDTGPRQGIGETCETSPQWTLGLLPEASPASRPVLQESDWERQMAAGSGRKLLPLLKGLGPRGFCLRTLLESCLSTTEWSSRVSVLRWKAKGTRFNRLLFQLAPLERTIDGTEFGSVPSPNATAFKGGRLTPRIGPRNPETNNYQDYCSLVWGMRYPLPEFGEALMGYPAGWTCVETSQSETVLSPKLPINSSSE